eukprot:TRINITY_DN7045_c0_g1_i4.p1 TRINITY_DN7045_c0_g1~~TRINITY_DN7045_c0_g1_i4.p1  ORF type:complete len:211 (+),score=35.96 TRINITY_DN7045_c0_g1_i4:43-675(+)
MATTADEFREILNADGTIDMNRLRDVSRHGVAAEVRGDVWKYLLGVSKPDKSQAATDRRKMAEEYHDLVKSSESLHQIKNDILRYTRRQSDLSVPNLREKAERVLSSFFNFKNSTIPYHSGIVSMTIAFFACVSEESDVYFCLKNLVRKIGGSLLPSFSQRITLYTPDPKFRFSIIKVSKHNSSYVYILFIEYAGLCVQFHHNLIISLFL